MLFYLNLVFAWISMLIAGVMAIIYFFRVMNKKKKLAWLASINRALRQNHKSLGVILIVLGLAHGILSSDKAIGFNLGTMSWVLSILLGLSFVYRKRFKPQSAWIKLHRFLTISFVGLIVLHIVDVGGFSIDDVLASAGKVYAAPYDKDSPPSPSPSDATVYVQDSEAYAPSPTPDYTQSISVQPSATETASPTPIPGKYIDGIYQGVAEGFRPGLTVEIEIKNDVIVSVAVISHNEVKERFWSYPVENIPIWIVDAQSADVDTVSGATYTSQGIIDATKNALQKALRQ